MREIYGAESIQSDYARKALSALWEGLCKLADADNDQLITLGEWLLALSKVYGSLVVSTVSLSGGPSPASEMVLRLS